MTPDFSPKLQKFLQGIRGPNGRPLKWTTGMYVRVHAGDYAAVCPICMAANIVVRPEGLMDWFTIQAFNANDAARLGLTNEEIRLLIATADGSYSRLRPAMLRHLGVA